MADKEAQVKPKTVIAVAPQTAVKVDTPAPAPKTAVASVYTASVLTTVQAAVPAKIKTTNPVVGRAKY